MASFHEAQGRVSPRVEVAGWLSVRGGAQVTLQFPAVLERLGLPAFDLCKLVGPFVRHEPTLPRELKRHLFSIEERVRLTNSRRCLLKQWLCATGRSAA